MTFDLFWKSPPPEKVAAVQELAERAGSVTSLQEQFELQAELNSLRDYRFGCNNGFMGRLLGALSTLGMIDEGFKHSGFTGNTEQDEMVVQEFDRDAGCKRPPLHKFCSNDGWLVSPTEIRGALSVYDSFPAGPRRLLLDLSFRSEADCVARFEEFIQFWRDAALHGGFEVY